jgi:hypothetical protein
MKATVHDETALYAECKRLYLIDAHTDQQAAEKYLRAISDVDAALLYIDAHSNSWTCLSSVEEERQVLDTLEKLAQEGLAFSKSQKERKQ